MHRLQQRTKRWVKKPKVKLEEQNREYVIGSLMGYSERSWKFNNKNRDRPGGHWKILPFNSDAYKLHSSSREIKRLHINEGLNDYILDQEDTLNDQIDYLDDYIQEDYVQYAENYGNGTFVYEDAFPDFESEFGNDYLWDYLQE